MSSGQGTWKAPVLFSAIFLVAWLLFTVGADIAVEMIDDFLLARVNKAVTDPEVLKNVQSAAVMVSANVSRSYKPTTPCTGSKSGFLEGKMRLLNYQMQSLFPRIHSLP